jgi:hypothetical protein
MDKDQNIKVWFCPIRAKSWRAVPCHLDNRTPIFIFAFWNQNSKVLIEIFTKLLDTEGSKAKIVARIHFGWIQGSENGFIKPFNKVKRTLSPPAHSEVRRDGPPPNAGVDSF